MHVFANPVTYMVSRELAACYNYRVVRGDFVTLVVGSQEPSSEWDFCCVDQRTHKIAGPT